MRFVLTFFIFMGLWLSACQPPTSPAPKATATILGPDERWGDLFVAVQMNKIFPDGKTFVDALPKFADSIILQRYREQKASVGFDLATFVAQHYEIPSSVTGSFKSDTTQRVQQHIKSLWSILTRQPDVLRTGSTLLPLPNPYVVPGGRFREIYYWDSYFTMLGLKQDAQGVLIRNMVDNFAHLINSYGHIPNGNRSYYISRSQPPFFAAMVNLLADIDGQPILGKYLDALENEYAFWMADSAKIPAAGMASRRVVRMPGGIILNRYYDDKATPRPESYREDVELQKTSGREGADIWRDVRAAAESGWDFSSRWFKDGKSLTTIHTTDIIPVDLNVLLYNLELTLVSAYRTTGQREKELLLSAAAQRRQKALDAFCWDDKSGFYMDYDFIDGIGTGIPSLAAAFPLYFGMANPEQARRVSKKLTDDFLKEGGFVTTLQNTGQQWDAPNGWAPLQWICINGMERYSYLEGARAGTIKWCMLNAKVFRNTGKMLEKYNVLDLSLPAGGGEYPVQDGFGWSNGVLQALLSRIEAKNAPETEILK